LGRVVRAAGADASAIGGPGLAATEAGIFALALVVWRV